MQATTLEQKREALDSANGTRRSKRLMRERVHESGRLGGRIVAELVQSPPSWLASTYVWQVTQWIPQVGDTKTSQMLRAAQIDPWRKVGRMTPRMRDALAVEMRRHADGLAATGFVDRGPAGPRCGGCDTSTRRLDGLGLCGFCSAERAEKKPTKGTR